MTDIYVDENGVLINKLGIKDAEKLKQAEADITIVRLKEILDSDTFTYGKNGYLSLHEQMFKDIYPFAGKVRRIDIEKSERVLSGFPMTFVHYKEIERELAERFKRHDYNFEGCLDKEKATLMRSFMSDIWEVHPFREGNTRTIITYAMKYMRAREMKIDENLLLSNFAYIRDALVMSLYQKPEYLDNILIDSIERGKRL